MVACCSNVILLPLVILLLSVVTGNSNIEGLGGAAAAARGKWHSLLARLSSKARSPSHSLSPLSLSSEQPAHSLQLLSFPSNLFAESASSSSSLSPSARIQFVPVHWPTGASSVLAVQGNAETAGRALLKLFFSISEKSLQLAFSLILMRMVVRTVQSIVESISMLSSSSSAAARRSRGKELSFLLQQNDTSLLTDQERQLLGEVLLPGDINEKWDELGGLQIAKKGIWEIASTLAFSNNATDYQPLFQPVKSFILFGPPGCGKTALVRGLAQRLNWPILPIAPSTILRPYFGESSMLTKSIFSLTSKMKNCIVMIDEMDSLFSTRSFESRSESADRQVKTEFMQLWDDIKRGNTSTLLVGMSNRPQDLDPAIQRRFERSFQIALPQFQSRIEIFRCLLRNVKKDKNFDFRRCARITEGYASSDIFELCKAAISRAGLRPVHVDVNNTTVVDDKLAILTTQDMISVSKTYTPTGWISKKYGKASADSTTVSPPSNSNEPSFWSRSQSNDLSKLDDSDEEDHEDDQPE